LAESFPLSLYQLYDDKITIITNGSQHEHGGHTESQRKTRVSAKTMYALSHFGRQERRDQCADVDRERELGSEVQQLFFLFGQTELIATESENARLYAPSTDGY